MAAKRPSDMSEDVKHDLKRPPLDQYPCKLRTFNFGLRLTQTIHLSHLTFLFLPSWSLSLVE